MISNITSIHSLYGARSFRRTCGTINILLDIFFQCSLFRSRLSLRVAFLRFVFEVQSNVYPFGTACSNVEDLTTFYCCSFFSRDQWRQEKGKTVAVNSNSIKFFSISLEQRQNGCSTGKGGSVSSCDSVFVVPGTQTSQSVVMCVCFCYYHNYGCTYSCCL